MKTLLFCTSYVCTKEEWNGKFYLPTEDWEGRYRVWYEYYKESGLEFEGLLMVDDGSKTVPWYCERGEFYSFGDHLGRDRYDDYAGWYRSFGYGLRHGMEGGYDKVIYCESDAYLLSERVIGFVNGLEEGWHNFWCPFHGINEGGIQVVCGDQLGVACEFTGKDYGEYRYKLIETMFPYTEVHKDFIGDRYGDYLDYIPDKVDYACQSWVPQLRDWFGRNRPEIENGLYMKIKSL